MSAKVSFGPYVLDAETLELTREGEFQPIEPLPARILLRLAQGQGSVVARRELLELGWPELPDAAQLSLNTAVHQIRRVLDGDGEVTLQTLRGRGYRLVVRSARPARMAAMVAASAGRLAWPVVAAGLVLVTGLLPARRKAPEMPRDVRLALERARYLVEETRDPAAALAVLDSMRARMPSMPQLEAEWAEIRFWRGDPDSAAAGADRALRLDSTSAGAHRVLGLLALLRSDWAAADAAFERALAFDSLDTRTLVTLAYRRTIEGRFGDANALVERALEIDPLSTAVHQDAGLVYLLAGSFDKAERYCLETLRFKPRSRWATDCLFDLMTLTGRTDAAARWGRRLWEISGVEVPPDSQPAAMVVVAVERWRLQRWIEAAQRGTPSYGLALAYAANGRPEDAVRTLEQASRQPSLGLLAGAVDPRLASVRGHLGFQRFLERLKLAG